MKILKLFADLSFGRILILAALSTVAYYFTYYDNGSTLQAQVDGAKVLLGSETARRAEIEKTMKKEEEMRGNVRQLQRNLEVVKSAIPNEFKDSEMSEIINKASANAGVIVSSLEADTAPPDLIVRPKDGTIRPEDLIEEVRFRIKLNGNYGGFLKFLDALTKEDKVIKIRNFTIEKNSENVDDDVIKFEGQIVGFKQAAGLANTSKVDK